MTSRVAILGLLTALCTVSAQPTVQQPRPAPRTQSAPQPVAERVLPGPADAILLDRPVNPFLAFNAFVKVLDAAGVRYGIEGPAWDPAAPPIDLARGHEGVVSLGGRRLGDALNEIVAASPNYRWSEAGSIVIVRGTAAGEGILDRRVTRFALTDAPPRPALEAVIAAFDPARPRGLGISGFGRPGGGAGAAPVTTGRNVTMSMTNTTVEAILAAIARLNGELSWTVKYDAAPAGVETANIMFIERGERVYAVSPHVQRQEASSAATGSVTRLPFSSTLPAMLLSYADRAGVRISIEEAAAVSSQTLTAMLATGVPPIVLPAAPADAIARLVKLDSRYEVTEHNGRFRVRPKAGFAGRLDVLDRPLGGFAASNEPARDVIDRVAQSFGTVRPAFLSSARGARGPSPIDDAMATPLTFTVPAPATVRDVLDAIADTTGWSWSFRPQFIPDRPTMLQLQWRGRSVNTQGTWSTGTTITATGDLTPTAMPARPPARVVPPALDRPIPRLSLDMGTGLSPFRRIGMAAGIPMGIESLPAARRDDPRWMTRPSPPLIVGPGQSSNALYVLLERMPGFEIVSTEGLVNVAPAKLLQASDYFMNQKIDRFAVSGTGLFRAVTELRRRLDPRVVPADWTGAGADTLNRPVTMSLTNITPREILNELARQHGGLIWESSFPARAGTLAPQASVADWVLTLIPIDNTGPPVSLTANGAELGSAFFAPPGSSPPTRSGGRGAAIDVPVTSSSLRFALSQAGRAGGEPIGLHVVVSSPTVIVTPSPEYYDLSGLTMAEILEKIQMLAPDYTATFANGVHHVAPKVPPRESTAWLDTRIPRFEHHFDSMRDALYAVAGLGPSLPPGARGMPPPPPQSSGVVGGLGPPSTSPSDQLAARLRTSIDVSLTNATVRDILDAIAKQRGAMMWTVEQRLVPTGPQISLIFSGYDGWSTATTVR